MQMRKALSGQFSSV